VRLDVQILIRAVFVALALLVLAGCSAAANALQARQRAVQDCILAGGHPRPGPGDTIICEGR